jgi:two-component system, NtrC family, response regulator AtoC
VARAVHEASRERHGPMIAVACAAIPEQLLESELFGHEKGAFTSAVSQRKGRFELAEGGTLLLDEIGDMPALLQAKLLRVLQERRFERVGSIESIAVDVRVVAATNRCLSKMVRQGTFREDLYYRLNVVKIELPPLRERTEDIPLLATHFAQKFARPGMAARLIAPDAMERLLAYSWPGNVRELESAIERGSITTKDEFIRTANLPADILNGPSRKSPLAIDLNRTLGDQLDEITARFEERYLRKAMRKTRGNIGRTAHISGMSRRSITQKIGLYKIDRLEFKAD